MLRLAALTAFAQIAADEVSSARTDFFCRAHHRLRRCRHGRFTRHGRGLLLECRLWRRCRRRRNTLPFLGCTTRGFLFGACLRFATFGFLCLGTRIALCFFTCGALRIDGGLRHWRGRNCSRRGRCRWGHNRGRRWSWRCHCRLTLQFLDVAPHGVLLRAFYRLGGEWRNGRRRGFDHSRRWWRLHGSSRDGSWRRRGRRRRCNRCGGSWRFRL